MPLSLSIKTGDLLNTSFYRGTGYELISNVTASVVGGQNNYAVTVPSGVYQCQVHNTTVSEKLLNGVNSWVIGA